MEIVNSTIATGRRNKLVAAIHAIALPLIGYKLFRMRNLR